MATDLPQVTVYPNGDEPNAVSLDTSDAPVDNAVSLPLPNQNDMPLPPQVAQQRTDKTMSGLGPVLKIDPIEMYQTFLDGQEQQIRRQAATSLDAEKAMDRQKAIQQMAVSKGGPLDPDEVQKVLDPFNPQFGTTDPDTVIEKAYAHNYVSSLNTAASFMSDNNPLIVAQQEVPQQAQDALDEGSELLTKNQYILKRAQDAEQLVNQQSYVGYGLDQAKQFLQPYVEYKERGLLQDSSKLAGLGLGSNIDEQHYQLYKMPMPEFKAKFDQAMDYLQATNPSLAASYAQSMLSQNTFDAALGNTFTALALPDAKIGATVIKKVMAFNQVRKAASDIVLSAARDVSANGTTALEGAGVVGEAAVKKVAGETVAALNGSVDPTTVGRQTLMSTWQTMADEFSANPGTYLSREEYTRLHDGFAKPGEDLLNRIDTMVRVERTPQATASEDVIRAYKDKIRGDFKGPPGMLADVEGPFLEPSTHTYWYKNKLVDYDGEQFSDSATAAGRAEQIGLANPTIEGTEAKKVYIPEAAILKDEHSDFTVSHTEGAKVTSFKTAKGSTYEVNGSSTTRNKAARPEHPGANERGPQPASAKTYYVHSSEINNLSEFQAQGGPKVAIAESKGHIGIKYLEGKDKGKIEARTVTPFKTEPEVGYHPVEVWKNGTKAHFGNPITEVKTSGGKTTKTHLPGSVRKVPRDDFELRTEANGNVRFFNKDGVEVQLGSKPQPGTVPYNLETKKFEPTLTHESARIEQQGLGFHIVSWTPMRENGDLIRDNMIKINGNPVTEAMSTSSATGIDSIKNSLLGWVRNSEDTLSIQESAQRKAATYAKSNVEKWATQLNQPLEKLKSAYPSPRSFLGIKQSKKEIFSQFERTLDASRRLPDPSTGEPGYFFKNAGELQDFYNTNFNRNPSVLETEAYFNYVKIKEGERMFSEIAEFRNRATEGYEQHQVNVSDGNGNMLSSGFMDARTLKEFPGGDDYVLIMGNVKGGEDLKKLGGINNTRLEELKRQVKTGEGRVIELYDIDHHPLSGFSDIAGDNRVRYVFSNNIESKPLEFNHVNKRGGAHFEWDYDHWIKQEDVRPQRAGGKTIENIYVGDKTVMPIKNKALGTKVTKMWNEAHAFIKAGDWDSARPIVAKLGIDWNEFTGWYKPGRDAAGKPVRALLDANAPMVVVSKGKNINNIDNTLRERYGNFKDGTKTGSLNNFKVAYNTERHSDGDLRTINDIGTKDQPIFAHQPADFVDPITTMNRSLNRSINSLFMDDYKRYGVEHWLREAEPYLEARGGVKEIRSSPFQWFNNPVWKSDMGVAQKMNLMTNRYKVQSFLGIPSKFDSWVHNFTEHLADTSYEKFGPEGSRTIMQKTRSIAPIWALQHLKNPVDFIRGATFNFKLGIFNPAQFLVQAQTHSLIWALEPRHGTAGTYAMLLHGWSRVNKNPAILDALDNYATKLSGFGSRFKPGEFKEGMDLLDRTGFEHVAGEYANLSKAYLPTTNFVSNDLNKGLRLGQTPFRLGEQSTRVTAWYTAFREFRETNPTLAIGNKELQKILQKADLLTVNMSRASSSHINQGIFSLSTQFLSYQIKLAELFWSKRIGETATDRVMARARLVTGFAMLYGLPNAVGVTGAPVADNLREHFMDDLGYIPGEKWVSTMLNEGFPAWSWAMISGNGDLQAGHLPNIGDRFGSQGWQNIKQAMRSNIPWWQAIGGAGVSTASNFMSAAFDPFYQGALSWARGDRSDERFTIRGADLLEPWKQVSTISMGARLWTALQTGKWVSANEQYETDVSPLRAALLATLGMNPQEQDDAFNKNQMVQGETEAQKAALKEFIKDWRRGLEAKENNDQEQGDAYIRNAMARLTTVGYPYEKILSAMAIANKGWEKAIDSANYNSWSRGDRNKQEQRLEQYKRQLQLDQQKAQ